MQQTIAQTVSSGCKARVVDVASELIKTADTASVARILIDSLCIFFITLLNR